MCWGGSERVLWSNLTMANTVPCDRVAQKVRSLLSSTPVAVICGRRHEDSRDDNGPCRRILCLVKGVGTSDYRVMVATRCKNNYFGGCAAQRSVDTLLITLGCETKKAF